MSTTQPVLSTDASKIRVLVVDDSAVVRGLISRQLSLDSDITVVATAANGALALAEMERREVDVVVLDIEMPVMDGMEALVHLRTRYPVAKVIMVSSLTHRNAEISLRALRLGASDYVAKPEASLNGAEDFKAELLRKIKALAPARLPVSGPVAHLPSPGARITHVAPRRRPRPTVLAIGSSTGGPPALLKVFEALKGGVEQPILLTQHMPATFTALLAEQLERVGDRPCAEAKDGEPVLPGRCYIAPGGWHMRVVRNGVRPLISLNQDPPENFCRPAVDPMLRSVAEVYGAGALTVILTGMGSDGARGCGTIAEAGGRIAVQDEASSVVWGMPGAAAATGLTECALPIDQMGPWILRTMEQVI